MLVGRSDSCRSCCPWPCDRSGDRDLAVGAVFVRSLRLLRLEPEECSSCSGAGSGGSGAALEPSGGKFKSELPPTPANNSLSTGALGDNEVSAGKLADDEEAVAGR